MTICRMDSEEEALFRSYPYALYCVQSPSTFSNNEPISSDTYMINDPSNKEPANRLALSRYSSSRGSTNSFLQEKKISYDDEVRSHGTGITLNEEANDHDDDPAINGKKEEDEDEEYYFERKVEWWRLLSFGSSNSAGWKLLQITWRFILSMIVSLFVFYIITKPPAPNMSIKMSRVSLLELSEGVDATGVTTKMLTCNISMDLMIENKSKLFGLHIRPQSVAMSFGILPLAVAQGPELQVGIDEAKHYFLYIGTRNKPMYGAGRSMEGLLESRKGLPLAIHIKLRSRFHVVWGLIKPKFHHHAVCLIVVGGVYDTKHKTQQYISRCTVSF